MPKLSNDDVQTLPDAVRREFDTWVEAEGLSGEFIISGDFVSDTELRAQVPVRGEDGEAVLNDAHDDLVTEERVYPIKHPLPAAVRPYLRDDE